MSMLRQLTKLIASSFAFQDWNDIDHGADEEDDVDPDAEEDVDDQGQNADVPVNLQKALQQAKLRGTEKRLEVMFGLG